MCLLVKVNQIGSITKLIAAVKKAKQAGWVIMTSHRSEETKDTPALVTASETPRMALAPSLDLLGVATS
jgi:enolase